MAKRKPKEKDAIDLLLDQIDFHGLTQEDVLGQEGLVKTLTAKILNRAMEAEMEHHVGYPKNSSCGRQYRKQPEWAHGKNSPDGKPNA